ncbi:unnamed protein product, partial [Prorocentrum cordatum]
ASTDRASGAIGVSSLAEVAAEVRDCFALERRVLRESRSDASERLPVRIDGDLERTLLFRAIKSQHASIPKKMYLGWLSNLRSFLEGVVEPVAAGENGVKVSDGCSGTNIWHHVLNLLGRFWHAEFGTVPFVVDHCASAEIDANKQAFLMSQFEMTTLVADVRDLAAPRHMNLVSQSLTMTPWAKIFGGGFSCKNKSKMNSQRAKFKSTIPDAVGSTGETFDSMKDFIRKTRPFFSMLENVPEIEEAGEDDSGAPAPSDASVIKKTFEDMGFTVVTCTFDAKSYGSPASRSRWWCLIWDIPNYLSDHVTSNFLSVLGEMKTDMINPGEFLLSKNELAKFCEGIIEAAPSAAAHGPAPKKGKTDANWKSVHESAFLQHGVEWPPTLPDELHSFRYQREKEVVFFANQTWPATASGWQFFDCNHTFERIFKYPSVKEDGSLKSPWKDFVPTLTAQSSIAARFMDSDGRVSMRHVHGLECMHFIGWSLGHYKGQSSPFKTPGVTPELLEDMAGNAWSGFAVAPIAIAALGAAHFDWYKCDARKREQEQLEESQEAATKQMLASSGFGFEHSAGADTDRENISVSSLASDSD